LLKEIAKYERFKVTNDSTLKKNIRLDLLINLFWIVKICLKLKLSSIV